MSACLPHHPPSTATSEAPTPAAQIRMVRVGGGGRKVPFDPRGRQRWKECAVQPVNTLTQRGEKNFLQAAFPTVLKPPPVTHGVGGRWGVGGEQRKSEADEEEGNEGCRGMEKVLDGRGEKKGGGGKKWVARKKT